MLYLDASAINTRGLFSTSRIDAGAIVAVWDGFIATAAEVQRHFAEPRYRNCSQIGADQFLVPHTAGVADHVNHSCQPNCGIRGTHTLVAMRDIPAKEEITYDYAMTDGCDYDVFDCRCQSTQCRRTITGSDWKHPTLQARYHGWFSEYIAGLIHAQTKRTVA